MRTCGPVVGSPPPRSSRSPKATPAIRTTGVDVRASSRRVVVRGGGLVVAESTRPKLLFETSNPIRYYLPFADVDLGRPEFSDTVSECPSQGDGQHWHLDVDGEHVTD